MATFARNLAPNAITRTLNDLGLAAWFGGSLMGAVGLNRAADATDEPARVSDVGWSRWSVVNGAAVAAYAIGGLVVTKDNKGRILTQSGVASTAAAKAALTGTAMVATLYARILGKRVAAGERDGDDAAAAQRRLTVVQWTVPALTGAAIVVDSQLSEQQRPMQVVQGVIDRLNPAA